LEYRFGKFEDETLQINNKTGKEGFEIPKAKRRYKPKQNEIVKFATLDDCEIRYKLSKKVIAELANDVGALYRISGVVRIDVTKLDEKLMEYCDNKNPDTSVWESDMLILQFIKQERSDIYQNAREVYMEQNGYQIGDKENDRQEVL
jgi:hypothetical protein